MRRLSLVGVVLGLFVGACGGSAGTARPIDAPPVTSAPAATAEPVTPVPAVTTEPVPVTSGPAASTGAADAAPSLVPGSVSFRVVNLSDVVVDVYIRTQGIVHAYAAASGVAPGTVTEDFLPPDPGTVVVVPADDTNTTCVVGCTFLAESSTGFGDGGQRTIVVRNDGATEYWEQPSAASLGQSSNAIGPADPARALVFVVAQGVTDAAFGLRMAHQGVAGCQEDITRGDVLIGGTTVVTFALPPAGIDATLHGNRDQDCAAAPVGGPFHVEGAPGSRTFLFLWGAMGAMEGLAVPIP